MLTELFKNTLICQSWRQGTSLTRPSTLDGCSLGPWVVQPIGTYLLFWGDFAACKGPVMQLSLRHAGRGFYQTYNI